VDSAPVELEGFAMCGQPDGFFSARLGSVEREFIEPGALEMERGVDLGGADERGAELASSCVIDAPIAFGDGAIQRVAQELVAEIEVADVDDVEPVQEPVIDEFLERCVELVDRQIITPASTVGLKQRPMMAPARATACASSDRRAVRARIASSMVSGTSAARIAPASTGRSDPRAAAISSSMWSGRPSERS